MNRDIKFRLWSKIGKKFIETDNPDLDFVINTNGYLYSIENFYGEIYILPQMDIEVLQFTGLQDRNGKEIYEGDIVKEMDNLYYKVIYVKNSACFVLSPIKKDIKIKFSFAFRKSNNKTMEIVGNIFENKSFYNKLRK